MNDLYPEEFTITKKHRNLLNEHNSFTIWITGLSCSGKTTLANELDKLLFEKGMKSYILDGDIMRSGLNKDCSFSQLGRGENLRRVAEVSKLFNDAGIITICAFISPYQDDRDMVQNIIKGQYFEVALTTPVEVCKERDKNNKYSFNQATYEKSESSDLYLDTTNMNSYECAVQIYKKITGWL